MGDLINELPISYVPYDMGSVTGWKSKKFRTNQNIWRHFRPWNIKKMAYFFDKSKVALEFLQHRGSKLKFTNLERNY